MRSTPAPLTRRLLAALETHAHEDTGPVGLADWQGLSQLFDRELALITRLATASEEEGAREDPVLQARAAALHQRYQRRACTLQAAAVQLQEERTGIMQARRRARAVSAAYAAA